MGYYCANYYGSIHCHNTVARFGERCKYCLASRRGASIKDGLLPEFQPSGPETPEMGEFTVDGERRRPERIMRPPRVEPRLKN